jgi:hypothetical protein
MIHVLGLEFDEEHNGDFRFQIPLFRKTLQAFMFHAYRYIRCSMWVPFCAKHLCSRSTQLFITLIRMKGAHIEHLM